MGQKSTFVKDTFVYGLGNGLKKFIGLFLLPFYTRALSVGEFGMLETLGTGVALLGGVLSLGLDSACGFYYFKASDAEKPDVLSTTLYLRLASFLFIVPLLFFTGFFSELLFESREYGSLIILLLVLVPVNLMMSEQSHLFRYFRQPWRYNVITILKSLVNIGLGITLVIALKQGVEGAMGARIGSSLLVVVVAFAGFNVRKYSFKFSLDWARQILKYGFPLIWAGIAAWIYNSSDRFFLLHYHDLHEVGLYSIGAIFSQPVLLVNMAVQMSFGVLFFQLYHKETDGKKPESRKMANDIFLLYLSGSVLLASALSFFAGQFIPFVATTEYAAGAKVVPFLVFSYIAAQSYQTMGPGISLSQQTWHFAWITALTALLNIGLNFLLVPPMGFLGAGLATLISFVVYWLIKVWVASRYFPVSYPYVKIAVFFLSGLGLSILFALKPDGFSILFRIVALGVLVAEVFLFKFLSSDDIRRLLKEVTKDNLHI